MYNGSHRSNEARGWSRTLTTVNRVVDFFLVGQPKSGTTALAQFLDDHPGIAITVPKEPGYWAVDLRRESERHHGSTAFQKVATLDEYRRTFSHAQPGQLVGDATTWYLYSRESARAIREYSPEARILMMLRNPVHMIRSLHAQHVNSAYEDIADFAEALDAEESRKRGERIPKNVPIPSWLYYRERGRYFDQVRRYVEEFGRDRILVHANEDLRGDPRSTYRATLEFLGVDDLDFVPDFVGVNESASPRFARLNRAVQSNRAKAWARRLLGYRAMTFMRLKVLEPLVWKRARRVPLDPALEAELVEFFRPDVRALSELLGRDFESLWFSPTP